MAYIANTAFERRVTDHAYSATDNITGVYHNATNENEICSAGFLCVKDDLLPLEGYNGMTNANSWVMKAAANGSTGKFMPIYACNTYGVNTLTDGVTGATYKVGSNTLGLAVPAGERATFTKINFDGESLYRFGIGNINGTLTESTRYLVITDGRLVPANTLPAQDGLCGFQILGVGNFTQGAYNGFQYVDVIAACVEVPA